MTLRFQQRVTRTRFTLLTEMKSRQNIQSNSFQDNGPQSTKGVTPENWQTGEAGSMTAQLLAL